MVFQQRLRRCLLLATGVVGMVSGCARPPPPAPVVVAPPTPLPALTILTIQHKAYAQGFAAGEWVQAVDMPDPGMPDTTSQTVSTQPNPPPASPAPPSTASAPSANPPAAASDFVPAGPAQPIPAQQ
jgi:hypothetical protein